MKYDVSLQSLFLQVIFAIHSQMEAQCLYFSEV